jgi:hypothetical protein
MTKVTVPSSRHSRDISGSPLPGCNLLWHTETSGVLAADTPGLRLVVQVAPDRDRTVRFMILRRTMGNAGPPAMVASGAKESVRDAMRAAEQAAARAERTSPDQTKATS